MLRQRARSAAIHLLLKCVNFIECIVNTPSPPGQMIGVVTKSPKALASLEMIDAHRGDQTEKRGKRIIVKINPPSIRG